MQPNKGHLFNKYKGQTKSGLHSARKKTKERKTKMERLKRNSYISCARVSCPNCRIFSDENPGCRSTFISQHLRTKYNIQDTQILC